MSKHGEPHGLTRVRGFTQDDAHLFCRPDQVKAGVHTKVIDLVGVCIQKPELSQSTLPDLPPR